MGVKDDFIRLGTFRVNSGEQTRFWEDIWLGSVALENTYSKEKHVTVARCV